MRSVSFDWAESGCADQTTNHTCDDGARSACRDFLAVQKLFALPDLPASQRGRGAVVGHDAGNCKRIRYWPLRLEATAGQLGQGAQGTAFDDLAGEQPGFGLTVWRI